MNHVSLPKREAWLYSPEGFDAASHGLPPSLENESRWLISTLYLHRVTTQRRDRDEVYFPLPARILAKVYGDTSKVKPVREACVRAGLVEVDNHYVVGSKSIGHRLGPALRGCKFRRWDGDGGKFLNRFRRFKAEWTAAKGLDALGLYLRRWCEKTRVADGITVAFDGMPDEKRLLAEHQVEMIRLGMIRATFCEYGRFHSNITGLCREIRPFLEIGGKRLIEIDIVGSQTLFLAELLTTNQHPTPTHHSHTTTPPEPPIPYDSGFLASVVAGTVYEDFQRHHGFASRGLAKERFFQTVYGQPRATRAFRDVWPNEGKTLRGLKVQHGYAWVPQEMQRRESHRFLRVAVNRLRREHPAVPILTIHDSAMTTEEHLALVERVIREAFDDFPFKPRLRIHGEIR